MLPVSATHQLGRTSDAACPMGHYLPLICEGIALEAIPTHHSEGAASMSESAPARQKISNSASALGRELEV